MKCLNLSESTHRHHLPPLVRLLRPLDSAARNKLDLTVGAIRKVAQSQRQKESIPFYTMREFKDALGVALRTVATAFERLEAEGLLIRIRGSHTRLLGSEVRTHTQINGVVGWIENMFMLRNYVWGRGLSSAIGESLRRCHYVMDTILEWENDESTLASADRVIIRRPDVAVWFQPLRKHRETFAKLRDGGIRSLIVCDRELEHLNGQILIDWREAYRDVLRVWQREHRIQKVFMPTSSSSSLKRINCFAEVASQLKMEVGTLPIRSLLTERWHGALPEDAGIVILDEELAVNFVQGAHFGEVARRNRILFARDMPGVVMSPANYRIDVLTYPIADLVRGIRDTILQWHAGQLPKLYLNGIFKNDGIRHLRTVGEPLRATL